MTLLLIVAEAAAAADQGSAGAGSAEPVDGTAAGAGSAAAAPSVAAAEGAGFPPRRPARECRMRSPYLCTAPFSSTTFASTTCWLSAMKRKTPAVESLSLFFLNVRFSLDASISPLLYVWF